MRAIAVVVLFGYSSLLWCNQNYPLESLNKYLALVQKVSFIEEDTKKNLHDLYFNKNYNSLRKLITPENVSYLKADGPSIFEVYTSYSVDNVNVDKESAHFIVTYNLVGYIIGGRIFCPRLSKNRYKTNFKLVDKIWKIESLHKNIPHSRYLHLVNAKEYFKNRKQSFSQTVTNKTVKLLSELETFDELTIYNAKLSYDTMLGLLFFDKKFDLSKGTEKFKNKINSFSIDQLRKLRNVIYAKYQFKFKDKKLINYYKYVFSSNLYTPYKESISLTKNDMENIKFIKAVERREHLK